MIFDWFENSRRMLKERKSTTDDEWDRRRIWKQEICMLRYLRFNLGKSKDECVKEWKGLKGGTAELYANEPLELDGYLLAQWKKANELGALERLPNIPITEGEVDYLNSLPAPLWVRRYWARLLLYVKSKILSREPPEHDPYVCAYFMRNIGATSRPRDVEATVRRWSLRCGIPFPEKVLHKNNYVSSVYDPRWLGGGKTVIVLRLGEFGPLDGLLDKKTFRCQRCGRKIELTRTNQVCLCPACREHQRRQDKTLSARKNKRVD